MKKMFLSLMTVIGLVAAFTSCSNDKEGYYPLSPYSGIFSYVTDNDTATVIIAPQGQYDYVTVKQKGEEAVKIRPMITLQADGTGTFKDGDWTGQIVFDSKAESAIMNMTNQKNGRQIAVPSLKRENFGTTLAGSWASPDDPSMTNMVIELYPWGTPDQGEITIDGVTFAVVVYGPDYPYGTGVMLINGARATYQLSALKTEQSFDQVIKINLNGKVIEMHRLYAK